MLNKAGPTCKLMPALEHRLPGHLLCTGFCSKCVLGGW